MDRHDFIRATLGVGVGAALGGPTIAELLGAVRPMPVPTVVGMDHVAEVRATATMFEGWDRLHGGGIVREAVIAELRYCAQLLDARCPDRVRDELFSAVGYFGRVAGFMAYDAYVHDDARRMFRFAQSCAEGAGNWQLRAQILSDLAVQANRCGDPDTGLTLLEQALVRADRLTATERSKLNALRARSLAKLGRVQDAAAAVGLADEEFSCRRPAEDPEWLAYYDDACHSAVTGIALWEVGVYGDLVTDIRHRLSTAVAGLGSEFARGRALNQAKVASLVMATGDPAEAVALGEQALDWAGGVRSHRVTDNLRELSRLAQPHQHLTEVADLRNRIAAVVAA